MGWFSPDPSPLDLEIIRVTETLSRYKIGSEEYVEVLNMVKELRDIRDKSAQIATLADIAKDIQSIKYALNVLETRSRNETKQTTSLSR